MVAEPRVYHYLKPNSSARVPRRHVVIDCAPRSTRTQWGHEQTWRIAQAWFSHAPKGRQAKQSTGTYRTSRALWKAVDAHCARNSRTIVWSFDLGYQARVSEAFVHLPALGWELAAYNLVTRACWMVWRRDTASIVLVDVASVWPTTVVELGKLFGLGAAQLPPEEATEATWAAFCASNVDIISTAVTAYLNWIEEADLGNWQMTGAGQSWAIFRHRFLTHHMLVHGDLDALDAERRAMWTGRCEAYWHGTILRQVVHEWDFSNAYARVAKDCNVPTRLIGPLPPRADWRAYVDNPKYALLAEVTVTTEVPTVPTEHDGHILWPVGTFDTTLWDVEIAEAIVDGAIVTLRHGWLYKAEPALRDWADWTIQRMEAPDEEVPAWQKEIHRHHGRALVGRFGMRYTKWEEWATMPTMGAERRTVIDNIEGTTYDIVHIGQQVFREGEMEEWSNSMPAVTGYVMACGRVRLWRLMKRLPKEALLYVDTDSLLVTDRWAKEVDRLTGEGEGRGLRLKKSWTGFTIIGPRQIATGDRVRMAGVPVRAVRTGRRAFTGQVYESVDVALSHGRSGMVRATNRSWHIAGGDRRRNGPDVGWTTPIRLPKATS